MPGDRIRAAERAGPANVECCRARAQTAAPSTAGPYDESAHIQIRHAQSAPYASITGHCGDLIGQFMADARRHKGIESQYRRERAYGIYMGWRALVAETADPEIYFQDDCRLEALLSWPAPRAA